MSKYESAGQVQSFLVPLWQPQYARHSVRGIVKNPSAACAHSTRSGGVAVHKPVSGSQRACSTSLWFSHLNRVQVLSQNKLAKVRPFFVRVTWFAKWSKCKNSSSNQLFNKFQSIKKQNAHIQKDTKHAQQERRESSMGQRGGEGARYYVCYATLGGMLSHTNIQFTCKP